MKKYLLTRISKTNATPKKSYTSPFKFLLITAAFTTVFISLANAQHNNLSLFGKVIEEKSKAPLEGATVHIKGTTHEVLTDNTGSFRFVTGQKLPVTFIVSYIGFQTQEVTFKNPNDISIQLKDANSQLNEVVVVGYGTQRKSDITGSVASVSKGLLGSTLR